MASSDRRKLGLLNLTHGVTNGDSSTFSPVLCTPTESPTASPSHDSQIVEEEERAVRRLLESWMDRLQLISVLAIFFASTEATLLSITMPQDQYNPDLSIASQAANVGLTGGLLLHILAAFISFLGGFFLIKYRIMWAKVEQDTVIMRRNHGSGSGSTDAFFPSPTAAERSDIDLGVGGAGKLYTATGNMSGIPQYQYAQPMMTTQHRVQEASADSTSHFCFTRPPPSLTESPRKRSRRRSIWVLKEYPSVYSSNHNRVTSGAGATTRGSGSGQATVNDLPGRKLHPLPTKLLQRFHVLCVILTLLGFVFSLLGIVCNVWERLPHVVGIACTIFVCTTLVIVLGMIFIPDLDPEDNLVYPSS
ncbi:hypothetical protein JR316_0002527 [Psilocybe cubensis]|uniref:Uncharacterized protein n=2 Tax=Psilocybe cubensis TaxID=181762 RepID=A0ACB8HD89_PSICU|nr:hypothetical protein JR316_0002527 [Psilocybe cubensis]KAH9485617.1 hypothetical protein JR316_0002527 [Psilocybe cubensis]